METQKTSKLKNRKSIEKLTVSALMIALGIFIALMCDLLLPFLKLPFGGSITIASMLPIIIVAYLYGTKWGLFTAFVYAIFQMILGGSTVSALFLPGSDSYTNILNAILICLIDYIIAYTVLGLGGIFKGKFKSKTVSLVLGALVALTACYIAHIISGAIFYGAWAEWFFTDTIAAEWAISASIMNNFSGGGLALLYSIIYNGCYMIPEIIITTIAAAAFSRLPQIK